MMKPNSRSTDTTESNGTMKQEQYIVSRQDSDMQSDVTTSGGCCSWIQCVDLPFVATEPFCNVEQRTIELHKQLWVCTRTANVAESTNQYTVVLPKLRYTPRLPRTGSMVMLNWCTLDSVATSATVETSLSQTEASLNLADDEQCEEEEEELVYAAPKQGGTQRSTSPCQWGYFVDSTSPTPNADQKPAGEKPSPTGVRVSQSYRRFMSREIEASARYAEYDPTEPINASREIKLLRRVEAQPNLQMNIGSGSVAVKRLAKPRLQEYRNIGP
jgi:hypothetical protein